VKWNPFENSIKETNIVFSELDFIGLTLVRRNLFLLPQSKKFKNQFQVILNRCKQIWKEMFFTFLSWTVLFWLQWLIFLWQLWILFQFIWCPYFCYITIPRTNANSSKIPKVFVFEDQSQTKTYINISTEFKRMDEPLFWIQHKLQNSCPCWHLIIFIVVIYNRISKLRHIRVGNQGSISPIFDTQLLRIHYVHRSQKRK